MSTLTNYYPPPNPSADFLGFRCQKPTHGLLLPIANQNDGSCCYTSPPALSRHAEWIRLRPARPNRSRAPNRSQNRGTKPRSRSPSGSRRSRRLEAVVGPTCASGDCDVVDVEVLPPMSFRPRRRCRSACGVWRLGRRRFHLSTHQHIVDHLE